MDISESLLSETMINCWHNFLDYYRSFDGNIISLSLVKVQRGYLNKNAVVSSTSSLLESNILRNLHSLCSFALFIFSSDADTPTRKF